MPQLATLIESYGLAFVFINVLAESAGMPLPAYPALIVAAALASSGDYSPAQILAVSLFAALIADCGWYWAGSRYGRKVLSTLCRLSLSPDTCVRQTESIFAKWGVVSLTFAKFIPGFASLATALAGTSRIRIASFLAFDAIGILAWSTVPVVVGIVFRDAISDVLDVLEAFGRWGLAVLVTALLLYICAKWWQRYRLIRQLRMDRISVEELQALFRNNTLLTLLDVRSQASQVEGGVIPGAVAVSIGGLATLSATLSKDVEVVVYCACPNEASAAQIANSLMQMGFTRVHPLKGGIDAWVAAGNQLIQPTFVGADNSTLLRKSSDS